LRVIPYGKVTLHLIKAVADLKRQILQLKNVQINGRQATFFRSFRPSMIVETNP
jgi:hypothetical protein